MGNSYKKLADDQIVGCTIRQIYHIQPTSDTIDYEGTYEIPGKLMLTVTDSSPTDDNYTKLVGGRYYLPHQTPLLDTNGQPVAPEILVGKTILGCERYVYKKKCLATQFRYQIRLNNQENYTLLVEKLSLNPR